MWETENSHAAFQLSSKHKYIINVWTGTADDTVIGTCVVKERPARVQCADMLEEMSPPALETVPALAVLVGEGVCFQVNGCTSHFAASLVRSWLNKFSDRWTGRGGPIAWPLCSPCLNSRFLIVGFKEGKICAT